MLQRDHLSASPDTVTPDRRHLPARAGWHRSGLQRRIMLVGLATVAALGGAAGATDPNGWVATMGGSWYEVGNDVAVDASGNVYVTGDFHGTADFDPGPGTFYLTGEGTYDIFVAKLDPSGQLAWAVKLGGPGWNHGRGIAVGQSGQVYATGDFEQTIDLDPGPGTLSVTSHGHSDVYLVRLDTGGNLDWATTLGSNYTDVGRAVALDRWGALYLTGEFNGTIDFDPGPATSNLTSAGGDDVFVQKLSPWGDLQWAVAMGGIAWDSGRDIVVDHSLCVYVTGTFWYTADFDPGAGTFELTSGGESDVFVLKLFSNGSLAWVAGFGGSLGDYPTGIALDSEHNVLSTGVFFDSADFDPGPGVYTVTGAGDSDDDGYLHKLDADGHFQWVAPIASAGRDDAAAVTTDSLGHVFTTGRFTGTIDFDPGPGSFPLTALGTGSDIFVEQLDPAGHLVSVVQMGGNYSDAGHGIAVTQAGQVVTTGSFYSAADFDPGPGVNMVYAEGAADVFVQMLAADAFGTLLADGFESGDTAAWSDVHP